MRRGGPAAPTKERWELGKSIGDEGFVVIVAHISICCPEISFIDVSAVHTCVDQEATIEWRGSSSRGSPLVARSFESPRTWKF